MIKGKLSKFIMKNSTIQFKDENKSENVFSMTGLLLILDIDSKEYLPGLTVEEGIRVLIGDQDDSLFPVENGISIEPGVAASISIRKVSFYTNIKDLGTVNLTNGRVKPLNRLFSAINVLFPALNLHFSH